MSILQPGPGFAQEVSSLLDQVKPTLPILLSNLTTVGQVLLTYNPALEQLLVVFPGIIAAQQSFGLPKNNPDGPAHGRLRADHQPIRTRATIGFLPPSQWRNPEDETTIDTPDGLYCKLPQDSPLNVRGARNYPCIEHPGKRAPTVELCNDPRGFVPTAMNDHALGPLQFDSPRSFSPTSRPAIWIPSMGPRSSSSFGRSFSAFTKPYYWSPTAPPPLRLPITSGP